MIKRYFGLFFLEFILLVSLLSPLVDADSQVYSNKYGKLEVYPITSHTSFRDHKQYYNITWSYSAQETVDIAFAFDHNLTRGGVYYWNGNDYIKVNHRKIWFRNTSFYVVENIVLKQNQTKHGYWEYTTKKGSGKWDMYLKRSVDTWKKAFKTGRLIHLDPWYSSDYEHMRWAKITDWIQDYPLNLTLSYTTFFNSSCQADFDDIVFCENNETLLHHWIDRHNTVNSSSVLVYVNLSNCGNVSTDALCCYFNSSTAEDTSNGNETFQFFDNFTGSSGSANTYKWYESRNNSAYGCYQRLQNDELYIYANNNPGVSGGGLLLTVKESNYDFDALLDNDPFELQMLARYYPTGNKKAGVSFRWSDPDAVSNRGYYGSYNYYSDTVIADIWTLGSRDRVQSFGIDDSTVTYKISRLRGWDISEGMEIDHANTWANNTGTQQATGDYNFTIGHSIWKSGTGSSELWVDWVFVRKWDTDITNGTWSAIYDKPPTVSPLGWGDADKWYLVSIPYNGTVSKFNVEIINETGTKKSWNDSVSSGWILTFLYNWTGTVYTAVNNFTAYEGFWMYFYIANASLYYSEVDNASMDCNSSDDFLYIGSLAFSNTTIILLMALVCLAIGVFKKDTVISMLNAYACTFILIYSIANNVFDSSLNILLGVLLFVSAGVGTYRAFLYYDSKSEEKED